MKIELGAGFLTDNVVVEEGTISWEHRDGDNSKKLVDHNGNVMQSKGFSIEAGTINVSRILSMPKSMEEAGYKVGDLIAHTLIRRQEFKHQHVERPIILIHVSSIVGKVELITKEMVDGVEGALFYERFVPAEEIEHNKKMLDEAMHQYGQGEWSGGREVNIGDPFYNAIHSAGSTHGKKNLIIV